MCETLQQTQAVGLAVTIAIKSWDNNQHEYVNSIKQLTFRVPSPQLPTAERQQYSMGLGVISKKATAE